MIHLLICNCRNDSAGHKHSSCLPFEQQRLCQCEEYSAHGMKLGVLCNWLLGDFRVETAKNV